MPSRARKDQAPAPLPRASAVDAQPALRGGIGKLACTKNFHCVKAHQAHVFYRVLVQLK